MDTPQGLPAILDNIPSLVKAVIGISDAELAKLIEKLRNR